MQSSKQIKPNEYMKKILFTFFAMSMAGGLHAQVSFYQGDKKLNNGDTITINEATVVNEDGDMTVSMNSKLKLKNESNTTSKILCSQHVVSYTEGGTFEFCVGNCTIGPNDKSLTTNTAIAGESFINGFDIAYHPQYEKFGSATATYTANIVGSTEKSKVTVIFNYQSTVGINSVQMDNVKVYSSTESLILSCPTCSAKNITLYDVLGKAVASYSLSGTLKEYVLPKMQNQGLYIYSLEMADGSKISGKLFVRTK